MSDGKWLPASAVRFGKPASAPVGSLVMVRPMSSERTSIAPAVRFNFKDPDDGEIFESLLWLQGWPLGGDKALRTASKCRDFHLNDDLAMIIEPSATIKIDVEFAADCVPASSHERNWISADGAIAVGNFGARIAALDAHDPFSKFPVAIDIDSWTSDQSALGDAVRGWFHAWRIRLWDGIQRTYAIYPYESPKLMLVLTQGPR